MAQPTRQEIIAYATEVAKKYGLDPEVFLAVINGESGFNPAAVGDNGQSGGLAQLYVGGGLGNVYQKQTGGSPFNPGEWMQHLDFMGQQVAQGGKGYEPWHAAKRLGIGDFQGVPGHNTPGTPGAPGPRDRGVATSLGAEPLYQPMAQNQQPNMMDFFKQWQEENKPQQNVLGALTNAAGWTQPGDPQTTVMGALFNSFKKKPTKLEEQVAGLNHYAPMSDKDQLDALNPKKKQQTVAGALLGRKPAETTQTQQGPTLMSALAGIKKADAAAGNATPNATLFKYLFG